jgi:hypothetical protein
MFLPYRLAETTAGRFTDGGAPTLGDALASGRARGALPCRAGTAVPRHSGTFGQEQGFLPAGISCAAKQQKKQK